MQQKNTTLPIFFHEFHFMCLINWQRGCNRSFGRRKKSPGVKFGKYCDWSGTFLTFQVLNWAIMTTLCNTLSMGKIFKNSGGFWRILITISGAFFVTMYRLHISATNDSFLFYLISYSNLCSYFLSDYSPWRLTNF